MMAEWPAFGRILDWASGIAVFLLAVLFVDWVWGGWWAWCHRRGAGKRARNRGGFRL